MKENIADCWKTSLDTEYYMVWENNEPNLITDYLCTSASDFKSITQRGQTGYDTWVKVRHFLDSVAAVLKCHCVPHQGLDIDDCLVRIKSRCTFIVYCLIKGMLDTE